MGAWRRFDSIRLRLAAIVVVAAVPLLLLSGTSAWQNYGLALEQGTDRAARLGEAVLARQLAVLDGMQQMLRAAGKLARLIPGPASCNGGLAALLAAERDRYAGIALRDALGRPICAAPPPAASMARGDEARRRLAEAALRAPDGFAIGPVEGAGRGIAGLLPAAQTVRTAGAPALVLTATLRLDWLGAVIARSVPGLQAVWLVDPAGRLIQLLPGATLSDPDPPQISALLQGEHDVRPRGVRGVNRNLVASPLPGALHLIVAFPASSASQRAGQLLAAHLAELALLLVLGLAAIGYGTHRALIEPLDQLGRAVARWRGGGSFDLESVRRPPREIAALAASFSEATRSVAHQGESLRRAAVQQDLLMKEIHHRVKNNLQIIASLLNLQASRIRLPAARTEFASARDRVRALATLHRHLYSQGELTTISMRPFLEELIGQLFEAMGECEGTRIGLSIEASPLQLSSDQAVPLALIVTEAVSNALKYAFPGGRAGHIGVRLTEQDGAVMLLIEDDGIGLPPGPAETETGTRDGLGMQLIRGFAKQLGASLEVIQKEGTRYQLVVQPGADAALAD